MATVTRTKTETRTPEVEGKGKQRVKSEGPPAPDPGPSGDPGDDFEEDDDDEGPPGGGGPSRRRDPSVDSWRPGPTGSFSEFKERGRKPDPFTGSRDKSEEFLMTFGTYLCFNKHPYSTESEYVDLFLFYINHTW